MNRGLINSLPEADRLLLAETEPAALAGLDEDALVALHDRIRRMRTKYVGMYRREGAATVRNAGGRGKARERNSRNRDRAEAYEDALSRVSTRLAAAARASAADLRAERIQAAREAKAGGKPDAAPAPTAAETPRRTKAAPNPKKGDRSLVSPRTTRNRAGTKATNARTQARRDRVSR